MVDHEILEWCNKDRLLKIENELLPAIRILRWSQKLHPIVLSWARRELVNDLLKSEILGSEVDRNAKQVQARAQWASLNGENSLPPCDPVDYENWYLEDEVLEAWSLQQWGHRLETLYLAKKNILDFISCSLIRVKDQSLAFELSLRLKGKEASFEQLSWTYGEGQERSQGGRFVHQRLSNLPSVLHPLIAKCKPGEVSKPHLIGDWFVIIALDELVPAQFDASTQSYLLSAELASWFKRLSLHLVRHLESLEL